MAKKQGLPGWVIPAGVAVVAAGVVAFVLLPHGNKGAGAGAPAALSYPALPTGRLQFISSGVGQVRYLDLDHLRRNGDVVEATTLDVGKEASLIGGRYSMLAKTAVLSCSEQRIANERASEFDATGKRLNAELLTGEVGRSASASDGEVAVLCAARPAKPPVVIGYRSAQHAWQTPPADIDSRAKADPNDADAWGWICSAGVRGRWRDSLPADCDHALKLSPDDPLLALDGAYLRMMLGKNAAADAMFKAMLARQPDNSAALFGRSLVAAIGGDEATSKTLRGRALDLDPNIGRWVTGNYKLAISGAYLER